MPNSDERRILLIILIVFAQDWTLRLPSCADVWVYVDPSRQFNEYAPSGGRVTSIGPDTHAKFWRHERDQLYIPRADDATQNILSGAPVMFGVAIAN